MSILYLIDRIILVISLSVIVSCSSGISGFTTCFSRGTSRLRTLLPDLRVSHMDILVHKTLVGNNILCFSSCCATTCYANTG